jgi:hypothetical protein
MGDGSMVRCVARSMRDDINKDVPDRTYTYCGNGTAGQRDAAIQHLPDEVSC